MKPAPFEYIAPDSLPMALESLREHGAESKILAGGQSLLPVMNFRLAQPAYLIDLNPLTDLRYIQRSNGALRIGAMTRQSELERSPLIATHSPLVAEALPHIAHPQIRNRGTIGGSLAHADPAAELPLLAVALNGRVKLQNSTRIRWVSAAEFFIDLFETALEPEEILTDIELPLAQPHTGYAFVEMARRHGDYALAGVAAWLTLDATGICRAAQLVYLNVGAVPMPASLAAAMLKGEAIDEALMAAVADKAATDEIDPVSDIHASAAYKRHLARVLTVRALRIAHQRAGERDT